MSTRSASRVLQKSLGDFSFAQFMVGVRTTLSLSQVEMANKLGMSRAALCEIEKGRTLVSAEAAARYARKAGFSVLLAMEAALQDQVRKAKVKAKVHLIS